MCMCLSLPSDDQWTLHVATCKWYYRLDSLTITPLICECVFFLLLSLPFLYLILTSHSLVLIFSSQSFYAYLLVFDELPLLSFIYYFLCVFCRKWVRFVYKVPTEKDMEDVLPSLLRLSFAIIDRLRHVAVSGKALDDARDARRKAEDDDTKEEVESYLSHALIQHTRITISI